jgi:hypothetical protein
VLHLAASWALAAILSAAAVMKLAAPARRLLGVAAAELVLAAGVAGGLDAAAYGAAALMAAFAGWLAWALARGRAGAPCGCFGARSRVGRLALVRALGLAGAFAALPSLPRGAVATETWLAMGLGLALAAILALTVAVLALAREVGLLKLAAGGQGALEVPEEGPPLGAPSELVERFAPTAETRLALAVFASEGCALCRTVAPSVELLGREAWLAVEVFDEARHADAWALAAVPGSPYAVALDPRDGTVLAKGTFNGLAQLESVVRAAAQRALEAAHA